MTYRVYFVDDEEILIREMRTIIDWQSHGFEVCGYNTDVLEAKEEILSLQPDIVFSDVRMDEMSGLVLAEEIAKVCPYISFVFLSAYDCFEYAVQALKIGAYDYLTKPINETELRNLLAKYKEKRSTLIEQNPVVGGYFSSGYGAILCIERDIRIHIGKKQLLSEYAKKYGYNMAYLSQMFKKVFGMSFKEYVLNYRIEMAKKKIRETDYNMQEIAFMVGYEDYVQFSKIFKKMVGISPLEYRGGIRESDE